MVPRTTTAADQVAPDGRIIEACVTSPVPRLSSEVHRSGESQACRSPAYRHPFAGNTQEAVKTQLDHCEFTAVRDECLNPLSTVISAPGLKTCGGAQPKATCVSVTVNLVGCPRYCGRSTIAGMSKSFRPVGLSVSARLLLCVFLAAVGTGSCLELSVTSETRTNMTHQEFIQEQMNLKEQVSQEQITTNEQPVINEQIATNLRGARSIRAAPRTILGRAGLRHLVMFAAPACMLVLVLSQMVPGGGRGGGGGGRRDPPSYDPREEATYPFRYWMQDLLAWTILATDLDAPQQSAAIILQLKGPARDLCRNMSFADMSQGGQVGGNQVDPVTFLLSHLSMNFAPLGEEQRLSAVTELMHFARQRGESIDALLSRFMTLRFRAAQGQAGVTMSWEGYSWLVLRACGVSTNQLMQLLQRFDDKYPSDEREYNTLATSLRRMGHMLEGAPGNLASALSTPPSRNFFADPNQVVIN